MLSHTGSQKEYIRGIPNSQSTGTKLGRSGRRQGGGSCLSRCRFLTRHKCRRACQRFHLRQGRRPSSSGSWRLRSRRHRPLGHQRRSRRGRQAGVSRQACHRRQGARREEGARALGPARLEDRVQGAGLARRRRRRDGHCAGPTARAAVADGVREQAAGGHGKREAATRPQSRKQGQVESLQRRNPRRSRQ